MREDCTLLHVVVHWLHSCSGGMFCLFESISRHVCKISFNNCTDWRMSYMYKSMAYIEWKDWTMHSCGILNILIKLFNHCKLHFHAEIKMEIMHFQEWVSFRRCTFSIEWKSTCFKGPSCVGQIVDTNFLSNSFVWMRYMVKFFTIYWRFGLL